MSTRLELHTFYEGTTNKWSQNPFGHRYSDNKLFELFWNRNIQQTWNQYDLNCAKWCSFFTSFCIDTAYKNYLPTPLLSTTIGGIFCVTTEILENHNNFPFTLLCIWQDLLHENTSYCGKFSTIKFVIKFYSLCSNHSEFNCWIMP